MAEVYLLMQSVDFFFPNKCVYVIFICKNGNDVMLDVNIYLLGNSCGKTGQRALPRQLRFHPMV